LYYPRVVIVKAAAWQAGGGFVTAFDVRGTNAAVPEPGALLLAAAGVLGSLLRRSRP
jgi:hypothetical protein